MHYCHPFTLIDSPCEFHGDCPSSPTSDSLSASSCGDDEADLLSDCLGLLPVTSPPLKAAASSDLKPCHLSADTLSPSEYRRRQLRALAHCIELLSQEDRPVVVGATGEEIRL
ncbi:hypothetical protein GUITHDRAFT_140379 [Guillardia theta CCMP2712]|uniref:Uncharacterized protein n=1 Tax=Guillardia theta (strain CCMP2712) TaxID=905079 RepID=L1J513_GUITC|nr:hypothetical protein GUITHDRAFT_140379 [Guillardia theta CCMP2712]EKX43623.1 hypothetical protein GUITHDRAFT_140379 [Guillardia theta CCMP2712]|eukprot:XP_005830603.1 hypothetical protein GUITHDRAFT_140379 [Guillardia theta CCMP2712]